MEAVILVGGKGTRLASRTNGLPKPLAPVNGKPLLEYQFELLRRHGVERVTLLCGFGAEAVREFAGDGSKWGLSVRCLDEAKPLGTAGAVIASLDQMPRSFIVLYGDTMVNLDLKRLIAAHERSAAKATLVLHPNDHPWDSDLVEMDQTGRIVAIHGYPHPEGSVLPNCVNAALYVLEASALAGFPVPETPLDFAKHLFPELLRRGVPLQGYRSPEYVKDAGTPERLDQVEADVISGKMANSSLDVQRPAVFLDRDGVINEEVNFLARVEQFKFIPGAAEAIKLLSASGYRLAVITNQPVVARGECSEAELAQIHGYMETELGREKAFLDGVYYCPHHPDKGFAGERPELKIECDCRKPRTGLVQRAVEELNLDLSQSWFIGDRTADIQTAHNCGVKSILLRTGDGGGDGRHSARPDYTFDNLLQAARFIAQQAAAENKA
jgi:D,D-heptose 1,7-bisphosphate phosphatase